MADEFLKIIDERIAQKVRASSVNTLPCRVVAVESADAVTVELITDGTQYTMPNYSGNYLNVGENVLVYYRGKMVGNNAYIGASLYKGSSTDLTIKYVELSPRIGEITETGQILVQGKVAAVQDTVATLTVNLVLQGTTSPTIAVTSYLGELMLGYSPSVSVSNGNYATVCLAVPIVLTEGEHTITIRAVGLGKLTQAKAFVSGQFLSTDVIYDDTTDDDYIYDTEEDYTDVLYYIGSSSTPAIPAIINDEPVRKLYATSFNYANIEAVYIPDGVEEIE